MKFLVFFVLVASAGALLSCENCVRLKGQRFIISASKDAFCAAEGYNFKEPSRFIITKPEECEKFSSTLKKYNTQTVTFLEASTTTAATPAPATAGPEKKTQSATTVSPVTATSTTTTTTTLATSKSPKATTTTSDRKPGAAKAVAHVTTTPSTAAASTLPPPTIPSTQPVPFRIATLSTHHAENTIMTLLVPSTVSPSMSWGQNASSEILLEKSDLALAQKAPSKYPVPLQTVHPTIEAIPTNDSVYPSNLSEALQSEKVHSKTTSGIIYEKRVWRSIYRTYRLINAMSDAPEALMRFNSMNPYAYFKNPKKILKAYL